MTMLKVKIGSEWVTIGGPGIGVAPGGTPGQVLVKASGTEYDTSWQTPPTPPASSPKIIAWAHVGAGGGFVAQQGFASAVRETTGRWAVTLADTPTGAWTMAGNAMHDGAKLFLTLSYRGGNVIGATLWTDGGGAYDCNFTLIVVGA
jgi:hypothetical protein